jgi:cytochrome P450
MRCWLVANRTSRSTSRNTASGGIRALIENEGERQVLVENPDAIPNAVEEMLR